MAIKNKDGSLYKVQGVNPLMSSQDHWEKDEWKIHYVKSDEFVIQGKNEEISVEVQTPAASNNEVIYCLPAIIDVQEDSLYGQKRVVTTWGEKFSFEAIRIQSTGISTVFFAKIDKLETGSILYVFKERQWWKVNGTETSEGGINIYCIPSEVKPSFVV